MLTVKLNSDFQSQPWQVWYYPKVLCHVLCSSWDPWRALSMQVVVWSLGYFLSLVAILLPPSFFSKSPMGTTHGASKFRLACRFLCFPKCGKVIEAAGSAVSHSLKGNWLACGLISLTRTSVCDGKQVPLAILQRSKYSVLIRMLQIYSHSTLLVYAMDVVIPYLHFGKCHWTGCWSIEQGF